MLSERDVQDCQNTVIPAKADPSGFEKDGKMSAGVARQWLGRFGKVDNGQVGTFTAFLFGKKNRNKLKY